MPSLLLFLLAAGCQAVHVRQPLPAGWAANDAHARTEFWYALASRPVITNDEAFHAILLYADNADPAADYPARLQMLRSRGMLPKGFGGTADEAVDRGTLAVALTKMLRIQGGLTMHMVGATPRYALRALEFRGIYPESSPNQILTGGEFVGVMQKAEEFDLGNPADAPASVIQNHSRRAGGQAAARAQMAQPVARSAVADSPVVASWVPQPESLDLAFVPPPRVAVYLDAGLDLPADANGNDEGLEVGGEALTLADPAPADGSAPPAAEPATPAAAGGSRRLRAVVTAVEGDNAEVRVNASAPWAKCEVGMIVRQSAEFRTGPKSSIQFIIQPDQTISLDSNGSLTVLDAAAQGNKVTTNVGLDHGRARYDLARPGAGAAPQTEPTLRPIRIEEAGLEHDAMVRSPHAALALRGTEVSLYEQEGFDPEAISLTGRAMYTNTLGRSVPFGGGSRAVIRGAQSSAVQQALSNATPSQAGYLARSEFELREISIVIQRGGFVVGNVVVGDLHLSDFPKLPGALNFVLQWSGTPSSPLNDLNLAVFSPLHTSGNPDFVSEPPFTYSLNPNSPATKKIVASNYPDKSRSGGRLTLNSVGPSGLEIAYWKKGFPLGGYRAFVFNLIDAQTPPTTVTNPVSYTIDVILNGQLIYHNADTIGFLQTSGGILEQIPPATAGAAITVSSGTPIGSSLQGSAQKPQAGNAKGTIPRQIARLAANTGRSDRPASARK